MMPGRAEDRSLRDRTDPWELSVIIVNYRVDPHVRTCLQALNADLDGMSWDAVVIDNGGSDVRLEFVHASAGSLRVLRNQHNVGFARAVNQGLRETAAPYVLIINPDCLVFDGAVPQMLTELRLHPECAIAGPAVLNPDGTVQGSARGDPTMLTGLFGRSTLLTRWLPGSDLARRAAARLFRSRRGPHARGGASSRPARSLLADLVAHDARTLGGTLSSGMMPDGYAGRS